MKSKIRVGILGCGSIGSELARLIKKDFSRQAVISGLCDHHQEKAAVLRKSLRQSLPLYSLKQLTAKSDLVIEAASANAVRPLLEAVLKTEKAALIMSVGALLRLPQSFSRKIKDSGSRIYLPSGAIAGVDGVLAAGVGKIDSVLLTSRKPPLAFAGAPGVKRLGTALERLKKEKILFEGSAREAVKYFPQNVNVAAVLSLAGIGAGKTRVRVIAVPGLKWNTHEVEVRGDFGRLKTLTENRPFPHNPKTSFLAALSAGALLRKIFSQLKIGT